MYVKIMCTCKALPKKHYVGDSGCTREIVPVKLRKARGSNIYAEGNRTLTLKHMKEYKYIKHKTGWWHRLRSVPPRELPC